MSDARAQTLQTLLRSRSDEHLSRKFFHLLSGSVVAFLFTSVFTRSLAIQWMVAASVVLIAVDLARLNSQTLNRWVLKLYGPLMRENEARGPSAQLFYVLGLSWAIIFLPRTLAVQAILTMAWMDPLAAIFGVRFGRRRWMDVFAKILPRELAADLLGWRLDWRRARQQVRRLARRLARRRACPLIWAPRRWRDLSRDSWPLF